MLVEIRLPCILAGFSRVGPTLPLVGAVVPLVGDSVPLVGAVVPRVGELPQLGDGGIDGGEDIRRRGGLREDPERAAV